MDDHVPFIDAFIAVILAVAFMGLAVCLPLALKIKDLKQQAIQLNHAEYNKTMGNWQWVTNKIGKLEAQ